MYDRIYTQLLLMLLKSKSIMKSLSSLTINLRLSILLSFLRDAHRISYFFENSNTELEIPYKNKNKEEFIFSR
jgi:hypothetical protein